MTDNGPSSNGLRLEWMDPYTLAENPLNPRRHPQTQRRALHAALESLGWLQPLLYNQRTGRLIDSHLRRQEAIESGATQVPVPVVELDETAERAALASIDSITGKAEVNEAEYVNLLRSLVEVEDDLVQALADRDDFLQDLLGDLDRREPETPEANAVHLVPGEQYHYVMLLFRSRVVGRTRVIDGAEYLSRTLKDA